MSQQPEVDRVQLQLQRYAWGRLDHLGEGRGRRGSQGVTGGTQVTSLVTAPTGIYCQREYRICNQQNIGIDYLLLKYDLPRARGNMVPETSSQLSVMTMEAVTRKTQQ